METLISPSIAEAVHFLHQQQVIAIPTETVYGLAGNAYNENVILKIFEIKNRPKFNPLIVHTDSIEKSLDFVQGWHPILLALAEKFTPGPITFLLPKKDKISDLVTAGSFRVAVRFPKHPQTLALLRQLAYPLAAPSANPFGYVSPTTSQHVYQNLNGKIPFILEGGRCEVGIESTIVGIENDELVVYRLGGVALEEIEALVGKVKTIKTSSSSPEAPGMLTQHYSPHKTLIVTNDLKQYLTEFQSDNLGVIYFGEPIHQGYPFINLSVQQSLREATQNLFHALRMIETWEVDYVVMEWLPDYGLGKAINDRIRRAAHKILHF